MTDREPVTAQMRGSMASASGFVSSTELIDEFGICAHSPVFIRFTIAASGDKAAGGDVWAVVVEVDTAAVLEDGPEVDCCPGPGRDSGLHELNTARNVLRAQQSPIRPIR
jgi:hypothetical protein